MYRQVAELVGASSKEVVFTSGATESINLAIQGTIFKHAHGTNKPRIAFSPLEHKAVLDTCEAIALSDDLIEGSLKIVLGKFTTDQEIEASAEILSHAIDRIFQVMLI